MYTCDDPPNVILSTGCIDPEACNYDPNHTYPNNDLCEYPDTFCGCEGQVIDECGICDGNNWDYCDDDGDGIINIEDSWPLDQFNYSDNDYDSGNPPLHFI